MKKNILGIIILSFLISYSVVASHPDESHSHGNKHENAPSPAIITNDNEYLTNLNLMKGHLWVGIELYKTSSIDNAKMHMKHPKSELYGDMVPTFKARGAPGFATELENLSSSVQSEESIKIVNDRYSNLFVAISKNEEFITQGNDSIDKKIKLVISLLEIAAKEYAIGIVNGKVENVYEYQDALGFTTMAKNNLLDINTKNINNKLRISKIIDILNFLLPLWPELVPNSNIDGDARTIIDAIEKIKKI
ncbi:MAG: hypothetical protein CMK44_04775 [Porticoccus sp.]|nr:hypothetical protein [Porticoccus sp.]